MSTDVAAVIGQLINQGQFSDAVDVGLIHETDTASHSPDYWFQYGLARAHAGLDGREQYWRALAHPDCRELMKADICRDLVGIAGRLGDYGTAARLTEEGYRLAYDDANRTAAIYMAAARVHSLVGAHREALQLHEEAHAFWQIAGTDADAQWVMNNRFYWLRAKALLERPRRILYREFTRSPESRADRRRQAAQFFYGGPFAARAHLLREIAGNHAYRRKIMLDEIVQTIIVVSASPVD